MKKQTIIACLAAVLAIPAHAESDHPEIHKFCRIIGSITHDAVRASLNGENRQTVQRKLENSYIAPLPNDPGIRNLLRKQVTHSLDKAYALYPNLRKLPKTQHAEISVLVGRMEYQTCMEEFLKSENSKSGANSNSAR